MVSRNFFRFNTTNIISAETDNEDILDEAVEWCDRYELLFSRVDPASELFRLNSAEGRPTAVDAELAAFIETALSYCREVDGLFDVTMGSATQLWNFKDCMIPARDDVAAALRHVDYRGVIVNECRRDAARPAGLRRFGRHRERLHRRRHPRAAARTRRGTRAGQPRRQRGRHGRQARWSTVARGRPPSPSLQLDAAA